MQVVHVDIYIKEVRKNHSLLAQVVWHIPISDSHQPYTYIIELKALDIKPSE